MNFTAEILAVQDALNALGHTRVNRDGLAGPGTWGGIAHELGLGIESVTPQNLRDVIATVQRDLARRHIYSGPADSIAGQLTWDGIRRALARGAAFPPAPLEDLPPPVPAEAPLAGIVDDRSEHDIATLHPRVQQKARDFILRGNSALAPQILHVVITSATRTCAEQTALYAQGRTAPGKRVTNAPAGFSNHNFGIAFDVTIFRGGEPVWESPLYRTTLAGIGRALGFTWGGDWKGIVDEPHYELHPSWASGMGEGELLAELRRRQAAGKDIFA